MNSRAGIRGRKLAAGELLTCKTIREISEKPQSKAFVGAEEDLICDGGKEIFNSEEGGSKKKVLGMIGLLASSFFAGFFGAGLTKNPATEYANARGVGVDMLEILEPLEDTFYNEELKENSVEFIDLVAEGRVEKKLVASLTYDGVITDLELAYAKLIDVSPEHRTLLTNLCIKDPQSVISLSRYKAELVKTVFSIIGSDLDDQELMYLSKTIKTPLFEFFFDPVFVGSEIDARDLAVFDAFANINKKSPSTANSLAAIYATHKSSYAPSHPQHGQDLTALGIKNLILTGDPEVIDIVSNLYEKDQNILELAAVKSPEALKEVVVGNEGDKKDRGLLPYVNESEFGIAVYASGYRIFNHSKKTDHFTIFYDPEDMDHVQAFITTSKRAFEDNTKLLDFYPSFKTRIYVFPKWEKIDDHLRLNQFGEAYAIAKYREIFIESPRSWCPTDALAKGLCEPYSIEQLQKRLTHEYMHVLERELTGKEEPKGWRWFDEGLAEYAALGNLTEEEKLLMRTKKLRFYDIDEDIDWQVGAIFGNPAVMYAYAHSLVQYIAETSGEHVLKDILVLLGRDYYLYEAIREATGMDRLDLRIGWEKWVADKVYEHNSEK